MKSTELPPPPPRHRRLNPLNCCGGGCLGILILFGLVFSIAYSVTGRYRPVIAPPRRLPNNNGYNDFVYASRLVTGVAPYALPGRKPNITAMRQLIAQNQSSLSVLRIGLTKDCAVAYVRDPATVFPEVAGFRSLARIIAADELVKLNDGDYAAAFQSGLDGLQFSQEIMRGGPLIHSLVGVACQALVERSLVKAVDHLNADQCDRFASRLARIIARTPTESEILEEEKAFSLTTMMKMRELPAYNQGSGDKPTETDQAFRGMAWHFMRDRTIHEESDHFDRGINEARKPRSKRVHVPAPASPYADFFAFDFDHTFDSFNRMTIHNRLLLCTLAIRSYKLKHGRLPDSLSSLSLPALATTDPCTGEPFIYRPASADYLLYSVGPDGKNDGGVPANEAVSPIQGDMGIVSFRLSTTGSPGPDHRRVPRMKLPVLPKGAPALLE